MRDQLSGLLGNPYAPGYGDSFQQQYRDRNPRPAAWDEDAELAKAKAANDAQTGILGWTTDYLRGLGLPEGTLSNLNSAATFAPVTSDILDIETAGDDIGKAYDNPTWRNVGGAGVAAALAAVGLIPGAGEALGLLGSVGKRATGAQPLRTLISSQRYLDDAVVEGKRRAKDYTVKLSPTFTNDGEPVQVVLDGHHALAAAKADGVSPKFEVLDAQADDRIGLLDRGKIDDFLEATYQDSDYYDLATGRDFSWGEVLAGKRAPAANPGSRAPVPDL